MIHIEDVRFRYPGSTRDALQAFSLDVPTGSLFGLLGPNGSGKTTLISILTGLRRPGGGHVSIGPPGGARPRIAVVPQEYAFYPRLTVHENLRFFAGVCGVAGSARPERVAAVIAATGLEEFRRVRAARLSGGLKRRLNLAIGLLNEPKLLLLDEPTVGIDPQSRRFILEGIRAIHAAGTTIVYTSHYMEEVEALCDEIGVLDRGRLIARGNLQSLLREHRSDALELDLLRAPDTALARALRQFSGLRLDGTMVHGSGIGSDVLQGVLDCVRAHDAGIARIRYGQGNLETLFLQMTGRGLRD